MPAPRTAVIRSPDELAHCTIDCPCVVKPVCEVEMKGVFYVRDDAERMRRVGQLLARSSSPSSLPGHGVLVQEYISGFGVGFFALFDHGQPKRVFMHRRLREMPISGGASTAACAYYDETLKEYGLRILSALQWHGVAMVEFKRQQSPDRLVLMEINPKFWGSVELALEAGVDFASDLVPRVPRRAVGLQRMLRSPTALLLALGRRHHPPAPHLATGQGAGVFRCPCPHEHGLFAHRRRAQGPPHVLPPGVRIDVDAWDETVPGNHALPLPLLAGLDDDDPSHSRGGASGVARLPPFDRSRNDGRLRELAPADLPRGLRWRSRWPPNIGLITAT